MWARRGDDRTWGMPVCCQALPGRNAFFLRQDLSGSRHDKQKLFLSSPLKMREKMTLFNPFGARQMVWKCVPLLVEFDHREQSRVGTTCSCKHSAQEIYILCIQYFSFGVLKAAPQ